MNLNIKKIAEYTSGTVYGDEDVIVTNGVIDSRKAEQGSLFIALKGENTDGHRFVETAFKAGAAAAMVQKGYSVAAEDRNVVAVDNTEKAMGDIAAGIIRERGNSLIKVAVTGSVGKTSTKDMIAFVLAQKYKTLKSKLNHNNELGLPLTVMGLEKEHQVLVAEMGMRGMGQIEYLTNIVKPDIAVITNIGVAHLELLGSRENILKAKLEVCKGMKADSTLVLNGDNDMLSQENIVRNILTEYGVTCPNIIYFGTEGNSDYKAENIHGSNYLLFTPSGEKFEIRLKVPGVHNVYNSMAAICVAKSAGISIEDAVRTLSEFGKDVSRQKIIEMPWGYIIDDTYNAGPESMEASLSVLGEMKADLKIAALGDMLELGEMTEKSHSKVGMLAAKHADILLAVGHNSMLYYDVFSGEKKIHTNDSAAGANVLLPLIKEYICKGKRLAILVKGSNAMKMNIISEALIHFGV